MFDIVPLYRYRICVDFFYISLIIEAEFVISSQVVFSVSARESISSVNN